MNISKNKKKMFFFSCPKEHLTQKVGSQVKRCALQPAYRRTHRQTDRHESEYIGHPFRVSGIFPSAYHQGSVQQTSADQQTYYQKILLNVLHLIASQSVSNRLYDAIHTRRDEQLACMFHWGMLRWYQYLICHSVMVGICCLSGE